MAKVPIKRGQTEEEIERYYSALELRAQKDLYLQGVAVSIFGKWRKGDNPNYIKSCEYGWQGFDAAAAVVHPLILVYNYIYRYHRNHTPWDTIPTPTENHPLLASFEVYHCLLKLCRENQELFLKQFSLTNHQRDDILMSLLPTGTRAEFESVYGELSNAHEMSNLCWELGLYHPDEDELIFSRFMEMPELYLNYCDHTQTEDWEEIEHVPMTNLDVLNRVQEYYDQYCEGRRHLKENGDYISKKEKEIINEILMRPEGDLFRNAFESGIVHLIEYDAETLEVVNIEDNTITSCPPFDDIEWEADKEAFPLGIKVQTMPTSQPIAQPDAQQPSEAGKSKEHKEVQEKNPAGDNNPRNGIGEQKTTKRFELPDDYFDYKDQETNPDRIIEALKEEIINAGPKVFAEIIKALTYSYKKKNGATLQFLASGSDNLHLVADILAGKKHDESKVVEWIKPVGKETEYVVLFLVSRLFEKGSGGKFERAYQLLLPQYSPTVTRNYASYGNHNSNCNLRKTIESIIKRSPRNPKQSNEI